MLNKQYSKRFMRVIGLFGLSLTVTVITIAIAVTQRTQQALAKLAPSDADYVFERTPVLPAPSARSIPYMVKEPLRNGESVPIKKRWLEVPEGSSIVLDQLQNSRWVPNIPSGTKLWKEFWFETQDGVRLIERRLTLKISPELATQAALDNEWIFISAFDPISGRLKVSPHGWSAIEVDHESWKLESHSDPRRPLPIQKSSGPTELTVSDIHNPAKYVFPGNTACYSCHGGATAGFRDSNQKATLAFGIHPDNLTSDSLRRLVEAGAVSFRDDRFPDSLAQDINLSEPATSIDETHTKFLSILRNNCISCHNADPLAAAYSTGFILDPDKNYSRADLFERLSQSNALRHVDRLPLVTPGRPEKSELVLRMQGHDRRRRMPPVEGGVPDIDEPLISLTVEWIQGFPKE